MKFSAFFSVIILWSVGSTHSQEPLRMNVMTFDGKSGYVELPQNLFDNLSEGTVETWVKWEKFEKWSRVFDFGRENHAVVVQTEKDKNSVNYRIWERKRKDHKIQARKKLRLGVWHHIAAVFGRSGMAFYLDGELIGTNEFEGGLDTVAGGNNYIGKSNWPKDKMFRGQMAEFRVWNRRLAPAEISRIKDRVLQGDEEGLAGYWRLGDAADGEAPSRMASGYSARLEGGVSVTTIPAISRFLVPGELGAAAQVAYDEADAAFQVGAFEQATSKFDRVIDLDRDFKDAPQRRKEAQQSWDLVEAQKSYVEGSGYLEAGGAARAYWAFDRALAKVFDFRDAASKRQAALRLATYDVGMFVFSSSKVRESLMPSGEENRGSWSRLLSSIAKGRRQNLLKKQDALTDQQNWIYEKLEEELEAGRPPYLRMRGRDEMRQLVAQSGATADLAHYDQVVKACKDADIPVLVVAEITAAYSNFRKDSNELDVWTTKKVDYTDSDGKKKKKEVGEKSYTTDRIEIWTEMSCLLNFRIVNTATGAIIDEGPVYIADSDHIDYINWDRYDGVNPSSLRIKDGNKFKKLSSDDREVIDARSTYKTEEGMLKWGASWIGKDMSEQMLKVLFYYSPRGN